MAYGESRGTGGGAKTPGISRREALVAGAAVAFAPKAANALDAAAPAPDEAAALVDVRGTGHSGREFMRALYQSQRVSVMDGGAFGRETEGFVRICFATDEATLAEACRRIVAFLQGATVAREQRRTS